MVTSALTVEDGGQGILVISEAGVPVLNVTKSGQDWCPPGPPGATKYRPGRGTTDSVSEMLRCRPLSSSSSAATCYDTLQLQIILQQWAVTDAGPGQGDDTMAGGHGAVVHLLRLENCG